MSIQLIDLLVPQFMDLGWNVTQSIAQAEKTLAFARWAKSEEENGCCNHCPGEWTLELLFTTTKELRELHMVAMRVWRKRAPLWLKDSTWTLSITKQGSYHYQEMTREWKGFWDRFPDGEEEVPEPGCYHHWPVVYARVD